MSRPRALREPRALSEPRALLGLGLGLGLGLVVGLGLVACGGRQRQANAEQQGFECKDRDVRYVAADHLGGSELGIQMDCAEAGPRIKRWRVDHEGTRIDDSRSLTPGEFDRVWREIDSSGWAYLKDCENGTMEERDPTYTFAVKDDQQQASFKCQSQSMPFPYNTIVDPLDLAAIKGGQLGNPEPAELEQYDRKDLQK